MNAILVEEEGKRKPVVAVPILVAVVAAVILEVVVLQWQLRRRRGEGEKKKDGEKEKRREGEVYVAVDEGFSGKVCHVRHDMTRCGWLGFSDGHVCN